VDWTVKHCRAKYRTIEVGDDAVHGVESCVLVLVTFKSIILDLLDETIDVVSGRTAGSFATDALQEHSCVADPPFTL